MTSGVGSAYKFGTPMSPYASGNFKIQTFKQEHEDKEEEDGGYQTPPGMEDEQLEDIDDKIIGEMQRTK